MRRKSAIVPRVIFRVATVGTAAIPLCVVQSVGLISGCGDETKVGAFDGGVDTYEPGGGGSGGVGSAGFADVCVPRHKDAQVEDVFADVSEADHQDAPMAPDAPDAIAVPDVAFLDDVVKGD
jgi:hypothetical protein